MPQLNQLLNQLPHNEDIRMATMGHALWVSWQTELPAAVNQTLLNYGGMHIGQTNDQALWFFFTNDVFLALARLSIWGHFNALPVSIELFPTRLQFTAKREVNLVVDGLVSAQEMHPGESLDIFVHPTSAEGAAFIPGIKFERAQVRQGMANVVWQIPIVDVRLPYSSTQSCFVVLHPLGNPLDKKFQTGWSAMFRRLETLLRELKIKSIVESGFVSLAIENLLMLRKFLREYLTVFEREKEENGAYWPCVCVVADRKNLNFNNEIPKKIGLNWDSLMPDFPYISYRNAYLLGEGYVIRDLRFSGGQTGIDSWCNIIIDDSGVSSRSIPLTMSDTLASSGDAHECFYCGSSHHLSRECPTRTTAPSHTDIWQDVAGLDLDIINQSFRKIEMILSANGTDGFDMILGNKDHTRTLLLAVFELNSAFQLRNIQKNWLYRFRELEQDEAVPQKDESPSWDLLEKLINNAPDSLSKLDKEIVETIVRHQRDPRLRMLRAFVSIENNDFNQAAISFKEAAAISTSPNMQVWNEFLQGRVLETQGNYTQASTIYAQIQRVMPQWREATYRGIVCRVKTGFAEQVIDQIVNLIKIEPDYFNHFLIDPALERGRLIILSAMYDLWEVAKQNAAHEINAVKELSGKLNSWFEKDHPVQALLGQKINHLNVLGSVNNYMAFFQVVKLRPQLEKELDESIQREVSEMRNKYKSYLDTLEQIRDESSWFPFPNALKEFSGNFNECAGIINWAFASNFNDADTFKKARLSIPKLDNKLRHLKKKLRSLKAVRDGTLFSMTMLRTFIWIEVIGLLLCFIGIPSIVFFGDKIGLTALKYLLSENQWAIQKVLIVIITVIALGLGALKTTIVFDRKREKLLEEAREEREKAQATRLNMIKRNRQIEARKMKEQKKNIKQKSIDRQLKAEI